MKCCTCAQWHRLRCHMTQDRRAQYAVACGLRDRERAPVGRMRFTSAIASSLPGVAAPASPGTKATDACIDRLRATGGPDARGGGAALGSTIRYLLGAPEGQFLTLRLATVSTQLRCQSGWFGPAQSYGSRARISRTASAIGDHIVEIVNRGTRPATYDTTIGVERSVAGRAALRTVTRHRADGIGSAQKNATKKTPAQGGR